MQVIRAGAMGMCFGVRDAIAIADSMDSPTDVTIYGELVHNEHVNSRLKDRGFKIHNRVGGEIPATQVVMITAHGVSNRDRAGLEAAGKRVIDTTCPLVRRAHDTALHLQSLGWHVVVAGKREHVEVIGLTGDLTDYTIIESSDEARCFGFDRLAVVCQTTLQPAMARSITDAIARANPESETQLFDTICRPTRDRQAAMAELLEQCDAIVVVGGAGSNNTVQLVKLAEKAGTPVCHVQSRDDLDDRWFDQYSTVGLTAGTSTPDSVIDEVLHRLLRVGRPTGPRNEPVAMSDQQMPSTPESIVMAAAHWEYSK